MTREEAFATAAEWLAGASALLVGAGAGMGVDSGLPDFRGNQGFWRAYPAYGARGLGFEELANPRWFRSDPALAWGFYGHRLNLYRQTAPHAGFALLRQWAERLPHGGFVYTSNVDGQFQRAGWAEDRLVECHGSIHHLQCTARCGQPLWSAEGTQVEVDAQEFRARLPLPACPSCGELARPAILMFGDWQWDDARTREQNTRLRAWLQGLDLARLVVVELGAGTAIASVRSLSEQLVRGGARLVRINPRESQVPPGQIGLPVGALEGLRGIAEFAR